MVASTRRVKLQGQSAASSSYCDKPNKLTVTHGPETAAFPAFFLACQLK